MYTKQPKKVSMFNILEILKQYTDENHRLTQKDIIDILRREYDMVIDRKTVKRNLMELIELGYEIEYTEKERVIKDNKTDEEEVSFVYTDFYLVRDFTDSELRLIIDSVLFSKHIPDSQRKDLVKKIKKLSSVHFKSVNTDVSNINSVTNQNKEFFLNLEILDEAILHGKMISFAYNEYKVDKKLHVVIDRLVEKPDKIIVMDGHYYLLCGDDGYGNIYRVDKITDMKLADNSSFFKNNSYDAGTESFITGTYLDNSHLLNLNKKTRVRFSVVCEAISIVVDYFGDDFRLIEKKADGYIVEVCCNLVEAYHWVLQYGNYVSVIAPSELRNEIRYTVERLSHSYSISSKDRLEKALYDCKKRRILNLTGVDLRDTTVLSKVTEPVEIILKMNFTNDFSFLKKYKQLKALKICERVENFSFIFELKELTALRLKETGFKDLSLLSNCKKLKKLCLLENELEHFEQLYELPKLEVLQIKCSMLKYIDVERLKKNNKNIRISVHSETIMI